MQTYRPAASKFPHECPPDVDGCSASGKVSDLTHSFGVKTHRDSLDGADIVDGTFLFKISQRNMTARLVHIDGVQALELSESAQDDLSDNVHWYG